MTERKEKHHFIPKRDGGTKVVRMPVTDHAVAHFVMFVRDGNGGDWEAFMSKIAEMDPREKADVRAMIWERTGRRVVFY